MVKSTTFGIFKNEIKYGKHKRNNNNKNTECKIRIYIFINILIDRHEAYSQKQRFITLCCDEAANNFISAINVWRCQFRTLQRIYMYTCRRRVDFWSWKVLDTIAKWLIFISCCWFCFIRFGWLTKKRHREKDATAAYMASFFFSSLHKLA